MQHLAVDAYIHTGCLGMTCQRNVRGADIGSTISRPKLGHGKLRQVNLVLGQHDLVDRRTIRVDENGRYARGHQFSSRLNQV